MTTTDERALLTAILAQPEEDTPRLVYADWLDENAGSVECIRCKGRGAVGWDYVNGVGQPPKVYDCPECTQPNYTPVPDGRHARAEFIRVQCELARTSDFLPYECKVCGATADGTGVVEHGRGCYTESEDGGGTSYADENPRRVELSRRERELWQQYAPVWFSFPGYNAAAVWDHEPHIRWCRAGDPNEENVIGAEATRGFVSSITTTAAAFLGEPCRTCNGSRRVAVDRPRVRTPDVSRTCPACHGTGSTEGIAAEVFRRHPVERVTLSDKEPWRWTPGAGSSSFDPADRYSWINADKQRHTGTADRQQAHIPGSLWPHLVALPGAEVRFDEYARYDTRDVAMAALSAACVRLGRARAALPPGQPNPAS